MIIRKYFASSFAYCPFNFLIDYQSPELNSTRAFHPLFWVFLLLTVIGNAKIEGLLPSLGMDGIQYNIALAIFFIPYVLAGKCCSSTN